MVFFQFCGLNCTASEQSRKWAFFWVLKLGMAWVPQHALSFGSAALDLIVGAASRTLTSWKLPKYLHFWHVESTVFNFALPPLILYLMGNCHKAVVSYSALRFHCCKRSLSLGSDLSLTSFRILRRGLLLMSCLRVPFSASAGGKQSYMPWILIGPIWVRRDHKTYPSFSNISASQY